jgi:hypothetical protein
VHSVLQGWVLKTMSGDYCPGCHDHEHWSAGLPFGQDYCPGCNHEHWSAREGNIDPAPCPGYLIMVAIGIFTLGQAIKKIRR